MKKVSIIIPAYNVQDYIGTCLESLVRQTMSDLELLIINDGSTDNTREVIESYREKYPDMIRAFHVENGGAAEARNIGLNEATGEYIGFVDSDDYVREDTYELLYNTAKEKDAEIVCSGYCRVGVHSIRRMPFGNSKIKAEEVFDKNVFEEPLLFDEVPYLWNKIFRRDIIQDNNLRFHGDLRIYEDLVFTYEAFRFAKRISRVNEHLYHYVVSRDTSLTYRFTEKRFDIIHAANLLNDFYKQQGVMTEQVREALLYVILKHVYVILNRRTSHSEKKLKLKYCRLIFNYLNEKFQGWKNNFYFEKQNKNPIFFTSRLYWMFCILLGRIPNVRYHLRKSLKKIVGIAKKSIRFLIGRRIGYQYIKLRKKPIEERSVFLLSQQGKNLHGNMFYLVKELATNDNYSDYTIYLGVHHGSADKFRYLLSEYGLYKRITMVKENEKPWLKALAQSRYLFSDTSLPIYFIKREGQTYLNTWHGTPLKTLGKATANDFFDIANVQKNFVMADFLLYPSEYMRDIMLRDYMLPGLAKNKILLSGYPRNEIFLSAGSEQIRRELELEGKQLIAYMPTWRGNVRNISSDQQLQITIDLLTEMDNSLSEDQILYVNMHPYVGNKIDFTQYSRIRKFPKQYETYEFLNCCDVLVTDYSSVFFDFAASRKNIILFVYDEEEYLADRGMYVSMQELPFKKVRTVEELMAGIQEGNIPQAEYEKFLDTYCRYDRPDMSKAICQEVILGQASGLKIEDMPRSEKKRILFYAGSFAPSQNTEDFIRAAEATEPSSFCYYFSYITRNVRRNRERFRQVLPHLNYWGQLGNFPLLSKWDSFVMHKLKKGKKNYPRVSKSVKRIFDAERERIYPDVSFDGVVLFGDLYYQKIYEYAHFPCQRILYISSAGYFNKRVHPSLYKMLDKILVTDEEIYELVKDYCGCDANVLQIPPIQSLNDFDTFFVAN